MSRAILFCTLATLAGCTHIPKCGNPDGARVVLTGQDSCQVRIRQVTIGSDLKIPDSLKGAALSEFSLDWIEPTLQDGRIELGHFVLVPPSQGTVKR